jgi:hypothetical protein
MYGFFSMKSKAQEAARQIVRAKTKYCSGNLLKRKAARMLPKT